MPGKISLKELLNKPTEQIVQETIAPVPIEAAEGDLHPESDMEETTEAPQAASSNGNGEDTAHEEEESKFNTALLKGVVTSAEKGTTFTVEGTAFTVTGISPGNNRVFLSTSDGKKLSTSLSKLLGQEVPFDWKKGDVVRYKEQEFTVQGLNPASNNILLVIEGKQKLVKVNKVTKLSSAPVNAMDPAPVASASPAA